MDERQTVEQHQWKLFDSLRGPFSFNELADTLLWNAVDWRSRVTGLRAPDLADLGRAAQHVRTLVPGLDRTLEDEQELLRRRAGSSRRRISASGRRACRSRWPVPCGRRAGRRPA